MTIIQIRLSLFEVFRKAYPLQMSNNRYGRFSVKVDDETKKDVSPGFTAIVASIADSSSKTFTLYLENLSCSDEAELIAED